MPPPRKQPRSLTLGVLAAGLATIAAWFLVAPRSCSRATAPIAARPVAAPVTPAASARSVDALPMVTAPSVVSLPVLAEPPPSAPATTPVHRMQAFTVAFDRQGLRLERAERFEGRVKAPPLSHAEERIEFEAYDPQGRRVYQGSMDHPSHRHVERFTPTGEISRVTMKTDEAIDTSFTLRIPGELAIARIDFFELHGAERSRLGSVELR